MGYALDIIDAGALGGIVAAKTLRRAREQAPQHAGYLADPAGFVRGTLHEFVWSKQVEILESIRDNRHTAVPACHGPGKSFTAARAVSWWLSVHAPGEAFAVTTAPSAPQVRAILWREINRAHRKGNLPGRTNQTEWWIDDEMVAFGRKPADTDPAAFQGIHAPYVLVVIDEADGVSEPLFTAAETLATNPNCRILAIGNPDDPGSHFAKLCKAGSGWNVIHISAFGTPNFTGEDIPPDVAANLVSQQWVEERAKEWGVESALYVSKVLGEFPVDAEDGVIPWTWIRQCIGDRTYTPADLSPVELGVDVGGGGDLTVVRERRGVMVGRRWSARTPASEQAVGLVMQAIRETGATRVKIDIIGVGFGVAGQLRDYRREGKHQAEIVSLNASQTPRDPKRFPKVRDEMWWMGRELSQSRGWDLSGVDDDTLAQLIAPRYDLDSLGRVKVESKADTVERIEHSPDDADALLHAFYTPKGSGWTEYAAAETAKAREAAAAKAAGGAEQEAKRGRPG